MSKFDDLKKQRFINQVTEYSEGTKRKNITISINEECLNVLEAVSKEERLPKSFIIRSAIIAFYEMSREEKNKIYNKVS